MMVSSAAFQLSMTIQKQPIHTEFFSVGGLRFEVTHLQYMDHLQIKSYGEGTNPEFDVTITDVKWSSVHDLIDAFLRCRGVK